MRARNGVIVGLGHVLRQSDPRLTPYDESSPGPLPHGVERRTSVDMFEQNVVDEGLVVPAPGLVHQISDDFSTVLSKRIEPWSFPSRRIARGAYQEAYTPNRAAESLQILRSVCYRDGADHPRSLA